jgi:hypothetical protein
MDYYPNWVVSILEDCIEMVVILLVVGCILIGFEIRSYAFGCVYG